MSDTIEEYAVASTWDVCSWSEMLRSLPAEYQSPKVVVQLRLWYQREVEIILQSVEALRKKGNPYHASMTPLLVNPMSSQMIAEFFVNDLDKPRYDSYNWHLQNTSQWVYAGAIVVDKHAIKRDDERVVSTHH